MSLKRLIGLDAVGLAIHSAVTACVIGFLISRPGVAEEPVFFGVTGVSVLILAANRAFVRWRGRGLDETDPLRLEEVEHRLAEIDGLHSRVVELEERLDFAERLLAEQAAQPARVGDGGIR